MKTLNLITLLAIMLTTIYANAQCTDCGNACGTAPSGGTGTCSFAAGDGAVASGNYSVGLGLDVNASGLNAVAIGNNAVASNTDAVSIGIGEASGSNSYSIGSGTANAVSSFAFGKRPHAYGDYSFAIGEDVLAHQDFEYNYIFGRGTGGSYMTNNISNSMMFGTNSTVPTVFIQGSSGAGTWGKVGIGTTDPDGILHLLEESAVNTDFVIEKADTKEARTVFHNAGTEAAYISLDASENMMVRNSTSDKDIIFNINDGGSNTEVMRVDGDVSRVGIGTTTPGQKLEVSGGNINVATSTNGYMINANMMLWNDGNTANLMVGHAAGNATLTGSNSTFVGYTSGLDITSASNNSFFGYRAGRTTTTGGNNTCVGMQAGYFNLGGSNNTFVGVSAGQANTSGGSNTFVGVSAGNSYTTASNNIFIGYDTDGAGTYDNCIAVGYNTVPDQTGANKTVWGNASTQRAWCQVDWSFPSDARIKNTIQENVPGIDFIKLLRPVTYHYDIDIENELLGIDNHEDDTLGNQVSDWPGKYNIEATQFTGFIAQEVAAAANQVGYDFSGVDEPEDGQGLWGLKLGTFVAPLVKAVQEQQTKIEELEERLNQCCSSNSNKTDENLGNRFNNDNAAIVELGRADDIILYQNIPNPFGDETTINFYLPETVKSAKMVFYDSMGKVIKEVSIVQKGNASVIVRSSELSTGAYSYSLVVDERIAGTKMMIKEK